MAKSDAVFMYIGTYHAAVVARDDAGARCT